MRDFYVGLMSGTSMDGIDAAVVSFGQSSVQIVATHVESYPSALKTALLAAIRLPLDVQLDVSGELHRDVGECFLQAARTVIEMSGVDPEQIRAIGSHGQTLRHQPNATEPFSLQIGDPDIIASGTGLTTVANFRAADIEAGGQGAPLVPSFHQWLFGSSNDDCVIVNIGGIANITVLQSDGDAAGFDTGPGNGLMDAWIKINLDESFDRNGDWGAGGEVIEPLLAAYMDDPYFKLPAPKSTGFEYFNPHWLSRFDCSHYSPADVQATLCELSARTIAQSIRSCAAGASNVFICGGGAHNKELMRRLSEQLAPNPVQSTVAVGLDPDWVEAAAFAWLAMRALHGKTGNLPTVTGASAKVVLGDIHSP